MKVVTKTPDTAAVHLTEDELATLSNAINESNNALRDGEFAARMGVERDEAEVLRKAVSDLLRSPTSESATVQFTRHELVILSNALREMRVALEDWEFHIRTGAHPAEAEALRKEISDLLDSLGAP
jgi:hypothetical protein